MPRAIRPILFIALPLTAALALGTVAFLFYMDSRARYLTERNLRALATLGQQVSSKLNNTQTGTLNATRPTLNAEVSRAKLEDLQVHRVNQPEKEPLCGGIKAKPNLLPPVGTRFEAGDPLLGPLAPLRQTQVDSQVYFEARGASPRACVWTTLGTFLGPFLDNTALAGLTVFLADENGRVLYLQGPPTPTLTNLDHAFESTDAESDKKPDLSVAQLEKATFAGDVGFYRSAYKLFSLPFRVPQQAGIDGGGADSPVWVIGALMPKARFDSDCRDVSFSFTGLVPLLILLGFLSFPLVKIRTMSGRDRLTARDVHVAGMCIVIVSGIVTVLICDGYQYRHLTGELDESLEQRAEFMRGAFQDELRARVATLESFRKFEEKNPLSKGESNVCTSIATKTDCSNRSSELDADVVRDAAKFPSFELVTLADRDGQQIEKWAPRSSATALISIRESATFQDPRDGKLLEIDGHELALNVIESPNTAQTVTVISVPVSSAKESFDGVAAMLPHLVSLSDPLLPEGLEFAVIQRDGLVVYHSIPSRRLHENFVAECNDNQMLRSAMLAGHATHLDLPYHARSIRAFLLPLEGTRWQLLVFSDRELLRTANAEIVLTAVGACVLYGLVYALVGPLVLLAMGRKHSEWLWPDERCGPLYLRSLVGVLIVGLIGFNAVRSWSSAGAIFATIAAAGFVAPIVFLAISFREGILAGSLRFLVCVPLVALSGATTIWVANSEAGVGGIVGVLIVMTVAVCVLALRGWPKDIGGKLAITLYVQLSLALVFVASVLPAVAFFEDAFEQGMESLQSYRNLSLAEAHASRADHFRREFGPIWNDVDSWLRDEWKELRKSWPPPAPSEGGVAAVIQPLLKSPHPSALGMRSLPVYNRESLELRHMAFEASSRDPLSKPPPQIAVPSGRHALFWWILAMPCGYLAFWTSRALIARMAGLELIDKEDAPASEDVFVATGTIHIRPPSERVAELRKSCDVIDLERLDALDAKTIVSASCVMGRPVLVDHLEYRADERDWNLFRLELLEALILRREQKVELLSRLDLLQYFARRLKSAGDPATEKNFLSREEMGRFATVFARLRKAVYDQPAHAASTLSDEEFATTVEEECSWTGHLCAIASELSSENQALRLDRDGLVERIRDLADAHYRLLWLRSTDMERLLMIQLANEGFVNPGRWNVVASLIRRGLIRRGLMGRTRAIRLMNESFRRFVMHAEAAETVYGWEHAEGASLWHVARSVFIAVLFVGGVFAFVTQPDMITKSLAFLTAMAGGAATVARIFDLFQAGRAQPERTQ